MKNFAASKNLPDMREIREALLIAVNDWLNYKCLVAFARDYNKV